MGTFNTLHISIICHTCKAACKDTIQFAYGEVWQHNYNIGDELLWGSNNVGVRGTKRVIVYGISERDFCSTCEIKQDNEYDIVVIDNIISLVRPMKEYNPYRGEEGGRFYIPSD